MKIDDNGCAAWRYAAWTDTQPVDTPVSGTLLFIRAFSKKKKKFSPALPCTRHPWRWNNAIISWVDGFWCSWVCAEHCHGYDLNLWLQAHTHTLSMSMGILVPSLLRSRRRLRTTNMFGSGKNGEKKCASNECTRGVEVAPRSSTDLSVCLWVGIKKLIKELSDNGGGTQETVGVRPPGIQVLGSDLAAPEDLRLDQLSRFAHDCPFFGDVHFRGK